MTLENFKYIHLASRYKLKYTHYRNEIELVRQSRDNIKLVDYWGKDEVEI